MGASNPIALTVRARAHLTFLQGGLRVAFRVVRVWATSDSTPGRQGARAQRETYADAVYAGLVVDTARVLSERMGYGCAFASWR
jgi:hypothetical protein